MTFARLSVAGSILLVACTKPSPTPAPDSTALQRAVAAYDADSLDPDVGVYASCLFEKQVAHPDGIVLLREFLVKDTKGQFLGADAWYNLATDCSGHEPGPDSYLLIASYSVAPVVVNDTLLLGIVQERTIGGVSFDEHAKPHLSLEPTSTTDTIQVRRTKYGWRIIGPALRQHILLSSEPAANVRAAFGDTLKALGFLGRGT